MNLKLWIPFFIAAFLVCALYIIRYIRAQKAAGIPARKAWVLLFLQTDLSDGATWVGTFGVVWLMGATYIDRVPISDWLSAAPHHPALAFVVGFLSCASSSILLEKISKRIFP